MRIGLLAEHWHRLARCLGSSHALSSRCPARPPPHPVSSCVPAPQVSSAQLGTLAKLAAGTLDAGDRMSTDEPAGNGAGAGLEELTMDDFRWACGAVGGWAVRHTCCM